jgi:hypothetical protein
MSLPNGEYYCLYIVFNTGKKAMFYSRDHKNSKSKFKDHVVGLKRLLKLALKHEKNAQNISIYDHRPGNPRDGRLIWQLNRGSVLVNLLDEIQYLVEPK